MEFDHDGALLIIDVQKDFCPGGALAVARGDETVPVINRLQGRFRAVVATQDWHPTGHLSFASSHAGKEPFQTVTASYGEQVLWPDHCLQDTPGAAFHPELDLSRCSLILRKGTDRMIDSYSAFRENDRRTRTGLSGYLKERGIRRIYLTGLATDVCVKYSALDGLEAGFQVAVIEPACRGLDHEGSLALAWREMQEAGVRRLRSLD